MTLSVGIHYGISPERYHRDDCERPALSSSIACEIVTRSPRHAFLAHPRLGGVSPEPSATMDAGTLLHSLVLGVGRPIVLVEADDWRTKAAKEVRESARAQGAVAILQPDLLEAERHAKAIKLELARMGIKLNGESEAVLVWEETADTGDKVLCRGQLDHLVLAEGRIEDLKFTADGSPEACKRRMLDMGYDIQAAAYQSGLRTLVPELAGRTSFRFLFCERDTDLVTPVMCGGSLREIGEKRWRRAVNRWARCLRTNKWPGYSDDTVYLEARGFEIVRELEEEEYDSGPISSAPTPSTASHHHQEYTNDDNLF